MNILITGSGGYLGGKLVSALSKKYNIRTVSSLSSDEPLSVNPDISNMKINWTCAEDLHNSTKEIDVVIHAFGLNAVGCEKSLNDAYLMNAVYTGNILASAIENEVKQFIYLSTAHVYGELFGHITESSLSRSIHPYGSSKRAGEDVVRYLAGKSKKTNYQILRLSNVFGPPFPGNATCWNLLSNDLCLQAYKDNNLQLKTNGIQSRNFLTMTDFLRVIEHLIMGSHENGIYNVGANKSLTVLEMATLVAERYVHMFGRTVTIHKNDADHSKENYINYDCAKLIATDFKFQNKFVDEIDDIFNYLAIQNSA